MTRAAPRDPTSGGISARVHEYAAGAGTGSEPASWDRYHAVRDWFAGLEAGAIVAWTNHSYTGGPWVLGCADIVVPAVEEAAPFNWLWTVSTPSQRLPLDEWHLVVTPDLPVWRLDIAGTLAYASRTHPDDVSAEELGEARRSAHPQGPEEWRQDEAISHAQLNRVQQSWVARHCSRIDVAFEYEEDLVGHCARETLERAEDFGPDS